MRRSAVIKTAAVLAVAALGTGAVFKITPHPFPTPHVVPSNTALPTVTGTTSQGVALHEHHGVWAHDAVAFGYQWEDCNSSGASCVSIGGATSPSYTLALADVGDTIRVVETAKNRIGSATATSSQTAVVAGTGSSSTGASLALCTSDGTQTGTPTSCGNGTTPTANLICGQVNSNANVNCGSPTATNTSLNVNSVTGATNCTPVGSGNCETRSYTYYIPTHLVYGSNAASNQKPAAVFLWPRTSCQPGGSASEFANSQIQSIVNADHMIVIFPLCYMPNGNNPRHPEIDCGGAGGVPGAGTCDEYTAGVTATDEFYVKAAVNDAITRFNLDPKRLYEIGGSANANMVRDTMCSTATTPVNGSLFRAVATMGGGANSLYGGTTGTCANTAKSVFWLEVMGDSDTSDPSNTIPCAGNPCGHTIMGFADTRDWWANGYLGNCTGPSTSTTGTGTPPTSVYDYTCTDGNSTSPFFEAVEVGNGGHTWCFLDDLNAVGNGISGNTCTASGAGTSSPTGGWQTGQWMMNFFVNTTTSP